MQTCGQIYPLSVAPEPVHCAVLRWLSVAAPSHKRAHPRDAEGAASGVCRRTSWSFAHPMPRMAASGSIERTATASLYYGALPLSRAGGTTAPAAAGNSPSSRTEAPTAGADAIFENVRGHRPPLQLVFPEIQMEEV
jgi:hypothetical protein